MTYELSVIIACYNEEKNLPELIERVNTVFKKKKLNGEIVLVNDGSTDGTRAVAEDLVSRYLNVRLVNHDRNQGLVAAWRSAIAIVEGEYICLIDADLQYLPEDIWRLYREAKFYFADIVQGFRTSIEQPRKTNMVITRLLNRVLNIVFSLRRRDPLSNFIVMKPQVLEDLLRHRYQYHYFQALLLVAAQAKGYTVREVEVLFQNRLVGKSFFGQSPLRTAAVTLLDITRAFAEFRWAYKPENVLFSFLRTHPPLKGDEPLSFFRRVWFRIFLLTMPLHHWLISSQAGEYFAELKRSQWLGLDDMRRLQELKLRKLVHQAYYHVPFYRQVFEERGLKPSDIKTIEDLQKLPLLTKQNVREHLYFDLLADNSDKKDILKITTSGSTGEPFTCYADRHQLELRWAATARSTEWTGYRFGDRQARLWHQTLGMTWSQVIRERIDAWFNRRMFIPAFEMSDKNIATFARKLRRFRPVLIDGYAESFNFLAHYLKNRKIPGVRPKGIISSAQELPDHSREIIEREFQCRVFDKYGSREFSGIAYECDAHEGHHVVAENYIVEILKNNKPVNPGEVGEVVITDLNNYSMPFIRYRIGDLATAMDNTVTCPCGRGLPRIGKIQGRVQAVIIGANGHYLPGTFFSHFFKDYDYIVRQYQVVQEQRNEVILKIVKAARFDEHIFQKLIEELKKYLGDSTAIKTEFVDAIPLGRTGKRQGCISRLAIDYQNLDKTITQ